MNYVEIKNEKPEFICDFVNTVFMAWVHTSVFSHSINFRFFPILRSHTTHTHTQPPCILEVKIRYNWGRSEAKIKTMVLSLKEVCNLLV